MGGDHHRVVEDNVEYNSNIIYYTVGYATASSSDTSDDDENDSWDFLAGIAKEKLSSPIYVNDSNTLEGGHNREMSPQRNTLLNDIYTRSNDPLYAEPYGRRRQSRTLSEDKNDISLLNHILHIKSFDQTVGSGTKMSDCCLYKRCTDSPTGVLSSSGPSPTNHVFSESTLVFRPGLLTNSHGEVTKELSASSSNYDNLRRPTIERVLSNEVPEGDVCPS